ncbi:hypothetical protein QOT17_013863 [Balamuthia mandrillaris]
MQGWEEKRFLGSGAFLVLGFSDLNACLARCFNTSLLLGGGLKRSPLGERDRVKGSVVRVAKKDTPVSGEFVCDVLCTKKDHTHQQQVRWSLSLLFVVPTAPSSRKGKRRAAVRDGEKQG